MHLSWNETPFAEAARSLAGGTHALLLSGPEGIGKRLLAEALIGWYLCEAQAPGGACGHCASCHLLQAGHHPDRIALEPRAESAAGEGAEGEGESAPAKSRAKPSRYIVVDQVRELLSHLELVSHGRSGRVVLVDPADRLNAAAANALLKTLEEPAARTIFILVTSAEERLPATVKSRCRRLPLGLPTPDEALAWLQGEGVAEPEQALRLAGGAPLRARTLAQTDMMDRWNAVKKNPSARNLRALEWDTTPEGLGVLCELLQRLCVDLQRAATGAPSAYAGSNDAPVIALAARLSAPAVADFWRALGRIRALIQHPLNGALVRDQMLLGYERLLGEGAGAP